MATVTKLHAYMYVCMHACCDAGCAALCKRCKRGLRGRNSPMCTLSQNGYNDQVVCLCVLGEEAGARKRVQNAACACVSRVISDPASIALRTVTPAKPSSVESETVLSLSLLLRIS